MASSGVDVSGSIATSTSGTMISRTVVSPRSKILSIISASCVVTSASPGSMASSALSSSRETKCRVSGTGPPTRRSIVATIALAMKTNGSNSFEANVNGRYRRRMRLVAHSRATALGMISPNTSMTGVITAVATSHAQPPYAGIKTTVAIDEATMCEIVTPTMAVDRIRSGWRKASR